MFAYCRNNPVRRIDISGTYDLDCDDTDPLDDELVHEEAGLGGGHTPSTTGTCNGGSINSFDAQQSILDGSFPGGYNYGGNSYDPLSSEISTGDSQPTNLNEQVAMKAARTNPQFGKVILKMLGDDRLEGFSKYAQYYPTSRGGIEIHYVGNPDTNTYGDFKFKFKGR